MGLIKDLMIDRLKPIVIFIAVALGALALAACGSDSAAPATLAAPAATSASPAATAVSPGATSVPVAPTSAPPAATPVPPTAAPTAPPAEPTAAPDLVTVFSEYGFTLNLDLGADVQTIGFTEPAPNDSQGRASFVYGGVLTNITWSPSNNSIPLEFVASTYNLFRASRPDLTTESISEGEITVSGHTGSFGGFKALDEAGSTVGGGLIGAWNCGSATAYRMTLLGTDATVVQLRFDRLLENFACSP